MQGECRFGASPNAAWHPTERERSRSRYLAFMQSRGFSTLEDLHRASIDHPDWFWREVVDDLQIEFDQPFSTVLDDSGGKAFPRWFVGGSINTATLCSHRHADGPLAQKAAVVYEGDSGQHRVLTYAELDAAVRRFAANLLDLGVRRGDRILLFLPVVPEAVVAYLAGAMIGAIAVPAFTGLGSEALAMRIRDAEPVLVVTADASTRRGRVVRLKDVVDDSLEGTDCVRSIVVVRHLGEQVAMLPGRDVYWDELSEVAPPAVTATTGSDEPVAIIYTSGTTGRPKGIVLSHAGFLVKAAVDFAYGFDIHDDDVIAWIADMGWMLGPLLIMGGLQLGATIVLTEGVPDYPDHGRLWGIAERNGVTFQGISPTAARLLMSAGSIGNGSLGTVRAFGSTGESWDEPTWQWLFDTVGGRARPVVNYTGGTETGGGILVAYPFVPADAASFNGPLPGMDVAVLDPDATPVVSQAGELAIFNTWPGMTHAFWKDAERYLDTYWSRWKGIWCHGDLARVDDWGSWELLGRSDDTIKVAGRRVGPAEIEAALLKDRRIVEAAAVGIPDSTRGQRVAAFVVLREAPTDLASITQQAAHNVGRSFAPVVHVVRTLPKTKNGKIMRRAIRARHLGEPAGDLSSLDPSTPLDDIPVFESKER